MKPKSKKGEIDYSGPVLAGGRLIVTGFERRDHLASIRRLARSRARPVSAPAISLPPVVANSTLYIYDDRGQLTRLSDKRLRLDASPWRRVG